VVSPWLQRAQLHLRASCGTVPALGRYLPGRPELLSGQAVETPASTLEPDRPWGGRPEAHPGVPDGRVSGEREMVYNDVIDTIGMAIDAAGVVIIVAGTAIGFVASAVRLSRRESNVYRRFRQQLSRAILLGLELLVAGDIVRTVAASPSLTGVAVLAAIVLIRTFLSFSLEVE